MRRVVENLGLNWAGQSTKLTALGAKFNCMDIHTVAADGKERSVLAMPVTSEVVQKKKPMHWDAVSIVSPLPARPLDTAPVIPILPIDRVAATQLGTGEIDPSCTHHSQCAPVAILPDAVDIERLASDHPAEIIARGNRITGGAVAAGGMAPPHLRRVDREQADSLLATTDAVSIGGYAG